MLKKKEKKKIVTPRKNIEKYVFQNSNMINCNTQITSYGYLNLSIEYDLGIIINSLLWQVQFDNAVKSTNKFYIQYVILRQKETTIFDLFFL